ncbi:MAG: SDR family oxidoreductase, partial [Candidatus Micrarchaeota archaeon]
MRVLVTGGAGYIGSVLSRKLLEAGYDVRVVDKLMFGVESVKDLVGNSRFELQIGDIMNYADIARSLKGVDAVVHLASIVGDPACAAEPDAATEINLMSTLRLSRLCREKKIERFIFASTCSVYGASEGDSEITETSRLNPVSLYAETKIDCEKVLLAFDTGGFSPTILRLGTLYGVSPRMRFDLVVNYLTWKAHAQKKIKIFNGAVWRPFVHIDDIANAFLKVLDAPVDKVALQTYNVGFTDENYRLNRLGEVIAENVPGTQVEYLSETKDQRSYRVSFAKFEKAFGLKKTKTLAEGVRETKAALESGAFPDPS